MGSVVLDILWLKKDEMVKARMLLNIGMLDQVSLEHKGSDTLYPSCLSNNKK